MRDRHTQAVLPIDQTMVDAAKVDLATMLNDRGCRSLIMSFGVGFARPGFEIPLDRLRYGRIVVVVDDSSAGRLVRSRVVSFLRRYMAPVVEKGLVYEVQIRKLRGMSGREEFEEVLRCSRELVRLEADVTRT